MDKLSLKGLVAMFPLQLFSRNNEATSFTLLVALGIGLGSWFAVDVEASDIEYNRDIRPILSDNCFSCHGPDSASRKADLRLDQRDAAMAAGAIVARDVEASELVKRILSDDPELVMPTPSSHKMLTDQQKDLLKRWVAAGAEYQSHWSFIPPRRYDLPEVRNSSWIRTPIDRFILAKLESVGLEPAVEADIRTLVRRVCLDLTGLPPTFEEIERVANDPMPDRYERYVEELLGRQTWGEHRGRNWLDYARYADSHGIHFDNYREMYTYRDWVIAAFNQNIPFDRFTVEQLAGDLTPNATLEQQIASGFNRCNITTNEGGAIDEEYQVLYTRDRVETTSAVWLGLTTGCAVCHDHKFDPISQREFYELAAFFNNTTQAAMDGNRKDTPPIIRVPNTEDRDRYAVLPNLISEAKKNSEIKREAGKQQFAEWQSNIQKNVEALLKPMQSLPQPALHLPLNENVGRSIAVVSQGAQLAYPLSKESSVQPGKIASWAWTVQKDLRPTFADHGDFERTQPFAVSCWVKLANDTQTGSLLARMDEQDLFRGWDVWLENGRVGMHIIHKWADNAIKVVSEQPIGKSDAFHHVAISYDGSGNANGVTIFIDGNAVKSNIANNNLTETVRTSTPLRLGSRREGSDSENASLQDVRVYASVLQPSDVKTLSTLPRILYLLGKSPEPRTDTENEELLQWYLANENPEYRQAAGEIAALEGEKAGIEARGTIAHVMNEKMETAKAFILFRGDYDKRKDEVKPRTPTALPPMKGNLPLNRMGLAQWIVDPENPLTARVTVNRFWQEVFGQGIVSTAGDFGITGQTPSHPELLDYLATQFVDQGWNIKEFFRQIVTSATYRQSATLNEAKRTLDVGNRLYSRGPRYRMDAEMVRDYALSASGLMTKKIGGPSVRPYQPPGVWEAVAMPGSDTRDYREDSGENLYRRSMYTFWKRSAPPASMEILNAPSREQCTVRRERTNTPLQALVTLNDPQMVEAARQLAQQMLLIPGIDETQRLQRLGIQVTGRCWTDEELRVIQASLRDLRAYYQQKPDDSQSLLAVGKSPREATLDATEHAAWTMLSNELLNLDEVLCK